MDPMLATLTADYFSHPDWIFERKFDGERCISFRDGNRTRLRTRNNKPLDSTYPEIFDALGALAADNFVLDGEIVAFEGTATSFSRLQERLQIRDREEAERSPVRVYYYIFDLMYLEGYDICSLPLRTRKSLLEDVVVFEDPLRRSAHRDGAGLECYREACRKGWEGVIAKRAGSRYLHKRSQDWLKFKCTNEQEFVIGGYSEPQGSRTGFGALLLGYYEEGRLRYAGKVGTGFDDRTLDALYRELTRRERSDPPFGDDTGSMKGVHFVDPDLVCEVGFTEWTGDGKLRHPRFLGLRTDKDAHEVVRERPA
ncbi:non-homologous end-joining DNA ligase [Methanolinea mesophila]|uniref:non-homologous end-joining DNA ligase n=1 Tax=Methanolinea mesophila TaxID=547055 RepID=UPI001AE70BFE|nr:non-homologous end-joining DNA ligase [Methanolinea mesophila]